MSLFNRVARFVTFANGGDVVYYDCSSRCSGYGTPERPHAADPAKENIPDGTIALDKRPALETPEGYKLVFRGPMVNPDIPDDAPFQECPVPSEIFAGAMASSGNSFGTLLSLQATKKPGTAGALDYVSISEYCRLWCAVGARIGRYVGGVIQWEESPARLEVTA